MSGLSIQLLGELSVRRGGQPVTLPASKKTRALLAYLVLTGRPKRRDRLCEMFWEIPDDPRGALRWSLSKLRRVVNDGDCQRLVADRERVEFRGADVEIDLRRLLADLDNADLTHAQLAGVAQALREPLLEGIDLPDQPLFQDWLTAEREEARHLAGRAERRLALSPHCAPDEALEHCRRWLDCEPFDSAAAATLLAALARVGYHEERDRLASEFAQRFHNAGIAWPPSGESVVPETPPSPASGRRLLARQSIRFCTARDGASIAYALVGAGPPLVKAANWLNHLELDWDAPIWSPMFRELSRDHCFVRYDERGNGLSDWDVDEISFEVFVTDLETVVEALGLERFPLLGISQGASVSIEYAVRHPERVSHLILFGGYAAGWRVDASPEVIREREAVMTLTETGWGQDNPAYRQIFSSTFMPGASAEELSWFNEFQRQTTTPANAARFLSAFGDIDVRDRLPQVRAPTLVIHSRGDQRIPLSSGREIAAHIPDAQFLSLESDNHLLLGREPASTAFVAAVRRFLHEPAASAVG